MTIALSGRVPPAGRRHEPLTERIEYRLLLWAAFVILVVVAAFGRLLPRRGAPMRGSVIAQARETANTIIPMAFMA